MSGNRKDDSDPAPPGDGADDELYDRALSEEIELMSDLIELAGRDPVPTEHDIDVALGVDDDSRPLPRTRKDGPSR